MIDLTLCIYIATSVVSILGGLLFSWWWIRMRAATEVFAYVTLLLYFIGIERAILAELRYEVLLLESVAVPFVHNVWWALRTIPELIIVTLIVVRMSRRACRTIRLERKYGRMDSCEGSALDE